MLNKSISEGKKAGIYASLGIVSGVLVHTVFAALGLSIIVAKSAMAFTIIKYLGVLYLLYLGIKALIAKDRKPDFGGAQKHVSAWDSYKAGLVTNVLNPKVALFFLSFFPQFINIEFIETPIPFIYLGLTYALLGAAWLFILTYFAVLFSTKLKGSSKFNGYLGKFSGMVYILMGVNIALTKK